MTTPPTMIALTSDRLGPPESYGLRDVPVPQPGEGQVRLRVEAVALGYVDALIANGHYQHKPAAPYVPGAEIVGIVDALGPGVDGVMIGDRRASWQLLAGGGLARFALARADVLAPVPARLTPAAAASLLLDHLTAWYALFDRGWMQPGETVLVLGAAGGIGAAAVQIASRAGARVIAAASSPEKRARALALGAEAAIDYLAPGWRDEIKRLTDGAGIDIVVDPVAGATFEPAFRSLAKGGRHLILGFAGGEIPRLPANLPLLKNGALIGVDARHLYESDLPRALEIWDTLFELAAGNMLTAPDVDVHPLDAAPAAFAAVARRDKPRKIVVAP